GAGQAGPGGRGGRGGPRHEERHVAAAGGDSARGLKEHWPALAERKLAAIEDRPAAIETESRPQRRDRPGVGLRRRRWQCINDVPGALAPIARSEIKVEQAAAHADEPVDAVDDMALEPCVSVQDREVRPDA